MGPARSERRRGGVSLVACNQNLLFEIELSLHFSRVRAGTCMATRRRRYVIGNFCSIVSTSDIFGIEFKQRMDELNHMMNERKFDDDLKQRCRMYYIESKETKRVRNYRKLEQEMSIHMRGEVACANNKSWLMKIWCVIVVVRSPPRRAPLLAAPIATPLQGGRPERSGLLFLKLLRVKCKKKSKKI